MDFYCVIVYFLVGSLSFFSLVAVFASLCFIAVRITISWLASLTTSRERDSASGKNRCCVTLKSKKNYFLVILNTSINFMLTDNFRQFIPINRFLSPRLHTCSFVCHGVGAEVLNGVYFVQQINDEQRQVVVFRDSVDIIFWDFKGCLNW